MTPPRGPQVATSPSEDLSAYGGIYIAASLVWLWLAEGQRPNSTDLIGAGIAIAGALVIIGFAAKEP